MDEQKKRREEEEKEMEAREGREERRRNRSYDAIPYATIIISKPSSHSQSAENLGDVCLASSSPSSN